MPEIKEILAERGARYGDFGSHAFVAQQLKAILIPKIDTRLAISEVHIPKETRAAIHEAVEMICHKLGRIANGDPLYADSWDDIAGYAKLVSQELDRLEL